MLCGSIGLSFRGVLGLRSLISGVLSAALAAAAKESAPTVAAASVGSAWACCCAGVRSSSMGASAAVCAKFSGASAAAALGVSVFAVSSLANLRWKDAIDHRSCLDLHAEGVNVVMDRGLVRSALVGAAVMARAAVRRRRNLGEGVSVCKAIAPAAILTWW